MSIGKHAVMGLGACVQGSLATWKSPVLEEFEDIPKDYKLICGVSMGYASDHVVNSFNRAGETSRALDGKTVGHEHL